MKARVLKTIIWKDEYFSELNKDEKLLFLYLLTNDNINMCGIYELNEKEICLWTELDKETVRSIKKKFMEDKKFIFVDNWVGVVNHRRHQKFGMGHNQSDSYLKETNSVPQKVWDKSIEVLGDKIRV